MDASLQEGRSLFEVSLPDSRHCLFHKVDLTFIMPSDKTREDEESYHESEPSAVRMVHNESEADWLLGMHFL